MTVTDSVFMERAIELSRLCPVSATAFSVGAVIVGSDGAVLAEGYSREVDDHAHAEESALAKVSGDMSGATMYSTLEPCGRRKSRPRTCAELIIGAGIRRVAFAWREPTLFVVGEGAEILEAAGVDVVEMTDFAERARQVNAHLFEKF